MSDDRNAADPHLRSAEREGRLAAAVASSSLAASLVDVSSKRVLVTSEAAARLLRAPREGLVGRALLDFASDEDLVANALAVLATGIIESYQAPPVVRRFDGTSFQGRVWVRLANDAGRQVFLIVFTDDSATGQFAESLGFIGPPPELQLVPGLDTLTGRETEVLERLVGGARVPQIAEQMFLAPATVRNHLSSIYRKPGVHTQADLVALLRPTGPEGRPST